MKSEVPKKIEEKEKTRLTDDVDRVILSKFRPKKERKQSTLITEQ